MKNIAITAANGGLGAAIIAALKKEVPPENITAIARTPEKAQHLGVTIKKGDYNNKADFDVALKDIDILLIVSGMDAPDKRIEQHRNIIHAAKDAGVKKLVYTSIIGTEEGTAFSPIVRSNRQTEEDVRNSGLEWCIGRNGIYIEADVEYMHMYKKRGEVWNSAGDGKCCYTTRDELAYAYAQMLLNDKHNGKTYNLCGESITQERLTELLNTAFGTTLRYNKMTVEDYKTERIGELGDFLGTVISGIYEGIRGGHTDVESHFESAAGRPHISWDEYFKQIKASNK